MTGYTVSTDWPTTDSAFQKSKNGAAGREDVVLARLTRAGDSIVYSTYIGGSEAEVATTMALSPAGDVCAAGATRSQDFPLMNPIQTELKVMDGFLTCLGQDGALSFSTYLGGAGIDWINTLRMVRVGNLNVAGVTNSTDLPTTSNAFKPLFSGGTGEDAFVMKIAAGPLSTLREK